MVECQAKVKPDTRPPDSSCIMVTSTLRRNAPILWIFITSISYKILLGSERMCIWQCVVCIHQPPLLWPFSWASELGHNFRTWQQSVLKQIPVKRHVDVGTSCTSSQHKIIIADLPNAEMSVERVRGTRFPDIAKTRNNSGWSTISGKQTERFE